MTMFTSPENSHQHSIETLNCLYEYDDFMSSINTMVDMGCGAGLDLEWWATRTTRDESKIPLNIKCLGVDLAPSLPISHRYPNIQYANHNFETLLKMHKHSYDVMWCHDAFQYVINPFETLSNWWKIISENGMLVIVVPQTTNLRFNIQEFNQQSFCYYNYTLVSLIHLLAVSGFDCGGGFFKKNRTDPWLHAVVYKSKHAPMDPRTTSWYNLVDLELLPETAVKSINSYGFLRQQDLVLPWLDKSITAFNTQ